MTIGAKHLTREELEAGLDEILQAPKDGGELKMIVRRPREAEREVLEEGELDLVDGLKGDRWKTRGSSRSPDNSAQHRAGPPVPPENQITVMNARATALVPRSASAGRWPGISSTSIWT